MLDVGCGQARLVWILPPASARGPSARRGHTKSLVRRARALALQDAPALFGRPTPAAPSGPRRVRHPVLALRSDVPSRSTAAFACRRRGLKPDTRLTLVCWRGMVENDWTDLPMDAITLGNPSCAKQSKRFLSRPVPAIANRRAARTAADKVLEDAAHDARKIRGTSTEAGAAIASSRHQLQQKMLHASAPRIGAHSGCSPSIAAEKQSIPISVVKLAEENHSVHIAGAAKLPF